MLVVLINNGSKRVIVCSLCCNSKRACLKFENWQRVVGGRLSNKKSLAYGKNELHCIID